MQHHIAQLREQGFTLIPGFFKKAEVAKAMKDIYQLAPTARELAATPDRYGHILSDTESTKFEFPYAGAQLNRMATHPRILKLVEEILACDDVLLSRSCVWAKYGGGTDYEQALHLDYEGNTLVVPREDGDFRQVNAILYYSDVTADLGPTYAVPLKHSKNAGMWPPHRYRAKEPALYKHEQPILAKAGDLLLFSMSTFHRGSGLADPAGSRYTHHLVYRSAKHAYTGHYLWAHFGEHGALQQFVTETTVAQRSAIGFPKPGDPYWNEATLKAVQERYPGMDMTAYVKAVPKSR